MALMILQLLMVAAVCAAFVPLASRENVSLLSQLKKRFVKKDSAVLAPPNVIHESGWTMIQCDDPAAFRDWLGRDVEGIPFKPGESPSLGSHVLIELFECDQDSLKAEVSVGRAMRDAAIDSKATVVAESFHDFKPFGVSGAVIIQESHYTIHTWPEHGYAAVDLFYCGGTIHVQKAVDVLIERFQPGRMKFLVVRRGVQEEVEG